MAQYATDQVLAALSQAIRDRANRAADDANPSYVARLLAGGAEAIGKKVGEEAAELAMAGVQSDTDAVVYEAADLWFHSLVLLQLHGRDAGAVLDELARRFGVSGLTEKAARSATGEE